MRSMVFVTLRFDRNNVDKSIGEGDPSILKEEDVLGFNYVV